MKRFLVLIAVLPSLAFGQAVIRLGRGSGGSASGNTAGDIATAQLASGQTWAVPAYFPGDANTVLHTTFPGTLGWADAAGVTWTVDGTPTYTSSTSDRGYGSAFSDANRLKLVSQPDVLDFASNFTLCLRFYPIANPATTHLLVDASDGGIKGYKVYLNATGNFVFTVCGTSCTTITSAGTVNLNGWNRACVGTFDNGAFGGQILNGVVSSYAAIPGGALNPNTAGGGISSLGTGNFGGGLGFTGRISEVWGTSTAFSAPDLAHAFEGWTIPPALDRSAIACFGDSLTEIGYPALLRSQLGAPWRVYNEGHSTELVSTSIWTRWRNYGRYLRAGTVIVQAGINDTQTLTSPTPIFRYIRDIAEEARASGARVVIGTLTPFKASTYYSAAKETARASVNAQILAYCATGAAACVDLSADFDDGAGNLKTAYNSGDGLHWNATGNTRAATLFKAVIAP